MKTIAVYSISAIFLLVVGRGLFCWLFPRDYKQNGRLSPFSILAGSAIFFAWGAFPYTHGIPGWPAVQVGPLQAVIGWAVFGGGLALILFSMGWLGLLRSLGGGSSALLQTGPYRFSRNPQVLGCWLYGFGFGLLWPTWYAPGWILLLLVLTHWMVRSEEVHLARRHGDAYEAYCQKVPRYLGRLKKDRPRRSSR